MAERSVGRVVALVEGGAVEDAGVIDGGGHGLGVGERGGHWFFAQDGFAGAGGLLDGLAVAVVRCRDVKGFEVGVGEQGVEGLVRGQTEVPGAGAAIGAGVGDADEAVAGGRDGGAGVVAGDPAEAGDAPGDGPRHQRSGRSRSSRRRIQGSWAASAVASAGQSVRER